MQVHAPPSLRRLAIAGALLLFASACDSAPPPAPVRASAAALAGPGDTLLHKQFALLAGGEIKLRNNAVISGPVDTKGDVGSRSTVTTANGGVDLDNTVRVDGDIYVKKLTTAAGTTIGAARADDTSGVLGTHGTLASPLALSIPAVPTPDAVTIPADAPEINVGAGMSASYCPGAYKIGTIAAGPTANQPTRLRLQAGVYLFDRLTLPKHSALIPEGPVLLRIRGNLTVGTALEGAGFIGGARQASDLRIEVTGSATFYHGSEVRAVMLVKGPVVVRAAKVTGAILSQGDITVDWGGSRMQPKVTYEDGWDPVSPTFATCEDRNQCTAEVGCNAGVCTRDQVNPCVDSNLCTQDLCEPSSCAHPPVDCAAANPCLVPTCDPATGCGTTPVPDGTSCDDGNSCTMESCQAGACVVTPLPSGSSCESDGKSCTRDACDGTGTCQHTLDCPATNECHQARFCRANGTCSPQQRKPAGESCAGEDGICMFGECQLEGQLSADNNSSFAIQGGELFGWGYNDSGRLGDGTTTERHIATLVCLNAPVKAVDTGTRHGAALLPDGRVFAWGANDFGQIGDGGGAAQHLPVQLFTYEAGPAPLLARRLALRGHHSLALLLDGSVVGWGRNNGGQLGRAPTTSEATPVPIAVPGAVKALRTGMSFSLALAGTGVLSWGSNSSGQLGRDTGDGFTPAPVNLPAGLQIKAIAAGAYHALALTSTGTVWAWGSNDFQELGNAGPANQQDPALVVGLSDIVAISAGTHYSLALDKLGDLYVWGINEVGQLGLPPGPPVATPTLLSYLHDGQFKVTTIVGGSDHTLARSFEEGTGYVKTWAWGPNDHGQLGQGHTAPQVGPVVVTYPAPGGSCP